MNWMVLPNQVCLIVKLYNNRPGLLPDSNDRNIFLSSTPSKRGSRRILHPVSPDIPISDGTFCPSGNKRFIPDGLLNKNILSGKSTSFPDGLLNYHSISEM